MQAQYFPERALGFAAFSADARRLIDNTVDAAHRKLFDRKCDAQIFVETCMKDAATGGYFEYECTADGTLKRAFWASASQVDAARRFGEVIQQVLLLFPYY